MCESIRSETEKSNQADPEPIVERGDSGSNNFSCEEVVEVAPPYEVINYIHCEHVDA